MKKLVYVVIGMAALAGCSNPEKTARYLIDPPRPQGQLPDRLGTVELKDVSLPEYASGDEIAWQTPDGAVRSNPRNIWADAPQRAFTEALARQISDQSGATVIAEPWPLASPPARRLDVRVERALGQADGTYRLSGRYYLSNDAAASGQNHARSFDITVPMGAQTPAAVARAQSVAIAQLAAQIAQLGGPGASFAASAGRGAGLYDPLF